MSWKSRIANASRPWRRASSPFSSRSCSAKAVDDSDTVGDLNGNQLIAVFQADGDDAGIEPGQARDPGDEARLELFGVEDRENVAELIVRRGLVLLVLRAGLAGRVARGPRRAELGRGDRRIIAGKLSGRALVCLTAGL